MILDIFISPEGSDENSGSAEAPLQSLQAARDKVRQVAEPFSTDGAKDIRLNLAAGTYRLDKTLVLSPEDGGDENFSVTWQGPDNGDALITSAYPLDSWQKLEDSIADLPAEVKGKVWFTDLPEGSVVNTLYGPAGQIARARGEAIQPQKRDPDAGETPESYFGPDGKLMKGGRVMEGLYHNRFGFPEGAIVPADDLDETEFAIIPAMPWTMNVLPVRNVDFEKNTVYLNENCTYPIGIVHKALEGSIWLENSLSVMKPGTWVYHAKTARLYYAPEGDAPEPGLEASRLCELIRVEGTPAPIQGNRPEEPERQVANITFRNLKFAKSNRFPFHGLTGKGIQHDWEMHDAPSCMLRFRHAKDCAVIDCTFSDSGSGGVRVDMASSGIKIENCSFSHLGGCGIVLCGYGLSKNYLNRDHIVSNNHIHHIGEHYWHSPAIFIWQSGKNTISDNHLHDLPYTGIVCSGRSRYDRNGIAECSGSICWEDVEAQCGKGYAQKPWYAGGIVDWWTREPLMHSRDNLIQYNLIHDVMQTMADGNGIYISGAGGGNIVRFNVVGPCPSSTHAEGLRCDDDQHQTILHGNLVFAQAGFATGITLKGINKVTNNILALPLVTPRWGMLSLETGPLNGGVFKRNIILTSKADQIFVGERRIHGTGREARLRDMDSDHNIYYCLEDPETGQAWLDAQQDFGNDTNSLACDPGFVDALGGDFNLKPDAAALKVGFKPLPLKRMFGAAKND